MKAIKKILFIPKFVIYTIFNIITFICGLGVLPFAIHLSCKKMREDPSYRFRKDVLQKEVYDELDPVFFCKWFDMTAAKLKTWCYN